MAKRAFQRVQGVLVDEYEDPPGVKVTEELPEAVIQQSFYSLRRHRTCDAAAERDELTPEQIEPLLTSLRAGDINALTQLAGRMEDPRVPPAIVAAARASGEKHADRFAQFLGWIGGPEAKAMLEAQLEGYVLDPQFMDDIPVMNMAAHNASRVAEALIRLDPDHRRAADVFVKLFDHPSRITRSLAIRLAVECYRNELATSAQLTLRRALRRYIDGPDDRMFLHAAPAFWSREGARVYPRWESLLHHQDRELRAAALDTLQLVRWEFRGWAAVVSRIPQEPSFGHAVLMAVCLGEMLPAALREELIMRALAADSPAQRSSALHLLDGVETTKRHEIARRAAADEPDPLLKSEFEKFATD